MKLQSLLHFRTDIKDKLPSSNDIELGEIAINHATDGETLFIKNNDDEIAEFKDTKYYSKITDDIYSKLDTIDKTIEENELVTASGLNNLNDRVLVIEDVIDNTIINEIENLYEELSKKQDSSDELNEVIENFNEKIEGINKEIADLDFIKEDISNSEEDIANIKEEISDLNVIRENISNNKEEINDIGHELIDIYQEISDTNKAIEDNEKVISAAITDLDERVTVIENGEIENPFFKSFATLGEYETAVANGEVVYPCVAFIEDSGTIKFMTD